VACSAVEREEGTEVSCRQCAVDADGLLAVHTPGAPGDGPYAGGVGVHRCAGAVCVVVGESVGDVIAVEKCMSFARYLEV
jgi:hypothetical protein